MVMPKSYDDLVERLARERDEKRFKPTKMTEAECTSEVEKVLDGAKSSFEGDGYSETPGYVDAKIDELPTANRVMLAKKRRGRPPGSKNKPKVAM